MAGPYHRQFTTLSESNSCRTSRSSDAFNRRDSEWTGRLMFANIVIVMGTSFMAGYIAITTTSMRVHQAFLPLNQTLQFGRDNTNSDLAKVIEISKQNQRFLDVANIIFYGCQLLGMFWFSAVLADRFGRRRILTVCSILGLMSLLVSWITLKGLLACNDYTSYHCGTVLSMILSRAVNGFQIGIGLVVAPVYLLELAPQNLRGSCASLFEFAYILGASLALFVVNYLPKPETFTAILVLVIYVSQAVMLLFVSESPRWLHTQGYYDKSFDVLEKLRGVDSILLEMEYNRFGKTDRKSPNGKFGWIIFLGVVLGISQLLTGREVISYFATQSIGPQNDMIDRFAARRILACIYVAINILSAFVNLMLIDRVNRRHLLFVSLIGMNLSLVGIATLATILDYSDAFAPVCIFCISYIAFFSIGTGPISRFMVAELAGQRHRMKAVSYSQSIALLTYFFLRVMFSIIFLQDGFPAAILKLPFAVSLFFGLVTLACALLVYFFMPETNFKALEESAANVAERITKTVPFECPTCIPPGDNDGAGNDPGGAFIVLNRNRDIYRIMAESPSRASSPGLPEKATWRMRPRKETDDGVEIIFDSSDDI